MPDIQIFDAASFFAHKIQETEQNLISKQAEVEILLANQRNLDRVVASMTALPEEQQRSLSVELASLREVRTTTQRAIEGLQAEIGMLTAKLGALKTAREAIQIER